MPTQPRYNFSKECFQEIKANTKDLLIIELQNVISQKNKTIAGLKSYHTKLIRTLNKN